MGDSAHNHNFASLGFRKTRALVISDSRQLVHQSAKGQRLQPTRCLRRVDRWRVVALSALQMVRGREGATKRLVVILPLEHAERSRCLLPRTAERPGVGANLAETSR